MKTFPFPRVAFQCDPWESLNPKTDTSLLLAKEALVRGGRVFFYTPNTLSWREGALRAQGWELALDTSGQVWPARQNSLDLGTMNLVWIRQNPPFDMDYITPTYLLETLPDSVRVLNDPKGLRDAPEKFFPLCFQDLIPPTLVSADLEEALSFWRAHQDIVLKPLYEFAGRGVVRLQSAQAVEDHWRAQASSGRTVLMQKFLPQVFEGDRRFFLINGYCVGGFNKRPAPQEFRANLGLGGTPEPLTPSLREIEICDRIGPALRQRGLFFVAIDVVGGFLLEVNGTSPTGIPAFNLLYERALEKDIWDALSS